MLKPISIKSWKVCGAAVGDGFYTAKEAFEQLQIIEYIEPDDHLSAIYKELYADWKNNITF